MITLMPAFGLCRRVGSTATISNVAQSTLSVREHGRKSIFISFSPSLNKPDLAKTSVVKTAAVHPTDEFVWTGTSFTYVTSEFVIGDSPNQRTL